MIPAVLPIPGVRYGPEQVRVDKGAYVINERMHKNHGIGNVRGHETLYLAIVYKRSLDLSNASSACTGSVLI